MKDLLFVLSLFLFVSAAKAQSRDEQAMADTVNHDAHDTMLFYRPVPGYDLDKYFAENIHYPDSARDNDVEGRVAVSCLVKKNGTISKCFVSHGVNQDLDAEALRVVSDMPRWKPGRKNGKPVSAWVEQAVWFKLE